MTAYAAADVVIEDYFGPYPAQVRTDRRWNGWAIPRFDRATAERIATDLVADGASAEWVGDFLRITLLDPEGTPAEPETYGPDADGMYFIGDGWTWEEAARGEDELG